MISVRTIHQPTPTERTAIQNTGRSEGNEKSKIFRSSGFRPEELNTGFTEESRRVKPPDRGPSRALSSTAIACNQPCNQGRWDSAGAYKISSPRNQEHNY